MRLFYIDIHLRRLSPLAPMSILRGCGSYAFRSKDSSSRILRQRILRYAVRWRMHVAIVVCSVGELESGDCGLDIVTLGSGVNSPPCKVDAGNGKT
jgi:hypothetical protein